MRITHRRKKEEPKKIYRHNEFITAPEILVLGADGQNQGVMPTFKAVQLARSQGLDLVEINPKISPPVGKILDFGQFRYQQEKETRLQKAHQHVVEIKGIRLSLRIGQNDLDVRKKQAQKFLDEGNKVKVELMMRGRELQQVPRAIDVVKNFVASVSAETPVRFEEPPARQANKIITIIAKT